MSYEKVKTITIKDNNIYITSACNNLRPLYFEKWQLKADNLKDAILKVSKHIYYGDLRIYKTVSKKWRELAKLLREDKILDDLDDEYWAIPYKEQEKRQSIREKIENRLQDLTIDFFKI